MDAQTISDTAAQLFREKGYRATTLQDIAQALGVSKGAIYHHCKSKDEILCRIYDRVVRIALGMVTEIAGSDLPPDEKMRRLIRGHVALVVRELPNITVFFQERPSLPPEHYAAVARDQREYDRRVGEILEEGIAQGFFAEMDVPVAVRGIVGMCHWLYQWYRPSGPLGAAEIADTFIKVVEQGYLRRDAARGGSGPSAVELAGRQRRLRRSLEETVGALRQQVATFEAQLEEIGRCR